nr:hypothetical protein [Methylobacterium sp. L1A1]
MARKDLELELLKLRFKNYTSDVRQCISRVVANERCEDTSDKVVDALWSTCHDDLVSLLAKSSFNDESSDEEGHRVASAEAREVIRNFIDQARDYEAELGDLEDDDFDKLYRTTFEPIVRANRDRRAQSARDRDRWEFFNRLEAEADFAQWRERLLSPAQAVALSFGKDPDIVTPERLRPFRRISGSPFREAFKDRLDLIEAAVASGQLSVPMSVGALNHWAAERGITLPSALTGETPGEDAVFWKLKYDAAQSELDNLRRGLEDVPPKTKLSIYRLLVGMAAARFEYRTDQRTKATAAIKDGLESVELSMSEDAILANLRQAALGIEYSWTTPIHWTGIKRR